MIIYQPAFDLYNCAFRLLVLTGKMKYDRVEEERLRIWDFYFVFPGETKNISFPSELVALRKIFKQEENPYEDLIDPRRIFEKMKQFQIAAMRLLTSYNFFDAKEFDRNVIKRTEKALPPELQERIERLTIQQENVIKLVTGPFSDLPLYGASGFKHRTKLIDFNYDAS